MALFRVIEAPEGLIVIFSVVVSAKPDERVVHVQVDAASGVPDDLRMEVSKCLIKAAVVFAQGEGADPKEIISGPGVHVTVNRKVEKEETH